MPIPKPRNYYTVPDQAKVDGTPVAYRRQGDGPATVFFHGAGFTRMWLPMYECCASSLDFIAPEHPGMGETPLVAGLEVLDDLTLHYDTFFDRIGLDKFHLIGYSGGAWMAAEYASFFYKRLKSLTLLAPVGMKVPDHPVANIFEMSPDELFSHLFHDQSGIADCLPNFDDPDEPAQMSCEIAALKLLFGNPFRYNPKLPRRLGRVQCPVLCVAAQHDALVPIEVVEEYRRSFARSTLVMVPAVGHGLVVERPDAVAEVLVGFVASVEAKAWPISESLL